LCDSGSYPPIYLAHISPISRLCDPRSLSAQQTAPHTRVTLEKITRGVWASCWACSSREAWRGVNARGGRGHCGPPPHTHTPACPHHLLLKSPICASVAHALARDDSLHLSRQGLLSFRRWCCESVSRKCRENVAEVSSRKRRGSVATGPGLSRSRPGLASIGRVRHPRPLRAARKCLPL